MFVFIREQKKREKNLHVAAEVGTRDLFCCIEERLGFFARRETFLHMSASCLVPCVEWFLPWDCAYVSESCTLVYSLIVVILRAPLEVHGAIIVAHSVLVVYKGKILRIGKERARDETMNERLTLPLSVEVDRLVPFARLRTNESSRLDTKDASVAVEQQSGIVRE